MARENKEADRLSFWGMYDNHTFKRYSPKSVDDLISQWRRDLADDEPISLCPVTVLSGETELRRVGEMLHPNYQAKVPRDEHAILKFKRDLMSDPDVRRLLLKEATDSTGNAFTDLGMDDEEKAVNAIDEFLEREQVRFGQSAYVVHSYADMIKSVASALRQAREEEREACAKIAENALGYMGVPCKQAADAIRARSAKEGSNAQR